MDLELKYQKLKAHFKNARVIESCAELIGWDERTNMPPGGADLRALQNSALSKLHHELVTDSWLGDALMELAIPPLSLLVSAQLLLFCVSLVWFQPFAVPLGLCLLVSAGYVASGLLQRRMPLMVWLGLLGAPLFILWKLLLYFSECKYN